MFVVLITFIPEVNIGCYLPRSPLSYRSMPFQVKLTPSSMLEMETAPKCYQLVALDYQLGFSLYSSNMLGVLV